MVTPELRMTSDGEQRWRVRFQIATRTATRTFADAAGADAFAKLIDDVGPVEAARILELRRAAPTGTNTVADWCTRYVDGLPGVEEGTRDRYRAYIRNDFDEIGDLPVTALTDDGVGAWVTRMQKAGASGKTISNKHGFLSGAMQRAVVKGVIPTNPCRGTRLPRTVTEPMTFLTHEEFARFRRYFTPAWQPFVDVLFATGLRFGEITALQVRDIDLGRASLTVNRAWKESKRGRVLGAPKTKKSQRELALAPETVAVLKPLVDGRPASAWVFVNARKLPVKPQTFYDNVWAPAVRLANGEPGQKPGPKAKRVARRHDENGNVIMPAAPDEVLGKRPRVHDARHTCASWLLGGGVPINAVQAHLGHESITTTVDRYGHLLPGAKDAVARVLSAALTGA